MSEIKQDADIILTDYYSDNLSKRDEAFNQIKSNQSTEFINYLLSEVSKHFISKVLKDRNLSIDIFILLQNHSRPFLEALIKNEDKDVRKVAVELITTLNYTESLPHIIDLLEDKDENVLCSTIEAMGKLATYSEVYLLFELYNKYPQFQNIIVGAISEIGGENTEDFIFEIFLKTEDVFSKMSLIQALAKVGESEQVLFKFVEEIQVAEEELRPIYLKGIYQIANRMNLDFELTDELRSIIYQSLLQNDEEYLLVALNLLCKHIILDDVSYFQNKFLIKNDELRNKLIVCLCEIEDKDVYLKLFDAIIDNIIELYSFEYFILEILTKIKMFEINDDIILFNNNLENLIRFLKSNNKIDSELGLNIIKKEFEPQTKEFLGKISKENN